jgi:hypothetical protein
MFKLFMRVLYVLVVLIRGLFFIPAAPFLLFGRSYKRVKDWFFFATDFKGWESSRVIKQFMRASKYGLVALVMGILFIPAAPFLLFKWIYKRIQYRFFPPTFFKLWETDHLWGSLECKEGCCGNTDGFYRNIVPVRCPCGGVIHGDWDTSSVNEVYGPYDEFRCDACNKEYLSDDVIKMKKKQTAGA